ncbi:MAG: CRTAC1 family protein [Thermoguttaceae bacterium]
MSIHQRSTFCTPIAAAVVLGAGLMALPPGKAAGVETAGRCAIRLREVTRETGIAFRHTDGSSGRRYIVETVSSGLALFDYDNDGWIDIYFVNGAPLPGSPPGPPPRNALYRNNGDWTFTDVTEAAGVGDTGFGLGVAVADYDNDGDQDIYVNNFGPNVLYRNNGDGTFRDVTEPARVQPGRRVGAGACFLDIEGDGDLDLYSANYVDFTFENHVPVVVSGYPQYAGPKDYRPTPHNLYRNNGDGTFSDISKEAGIADHPGTGMGTVCLDHNNDGDTDICVMNDVHGNFLFDNDGTGKFEEMALVVGMGFSMDGTELASMGVDCADYNNDGWLDLFQTSYSTELPALYRNTGIGFFEDVTRATGAGVTTYAYVNWGCGFADFDRDGDRDLYIANGHLQDNVERYNDITAYEVRNTLLMNTGNEKFLDVSDQAGDGMLPKLSSRGMGLDDLDNDGDIDVVVLNSRREPTVLRNDSETENHWVEIQLHGSRTNRDGVGARVRVVTGDLTQIDEVHSGRGYQSHHGTRLHFGLGERQQIDRVEVRWVGGGEEVFEGVAVDGIARLQEGTGSAKPAQ